MTQEKLEEVAEKYQSQFLLQEENRFAKEDFINGAKWQQERMYSEEDIMFSYEQGARLALISQSDLARVKGNFPNPKEWFETFKKQKEL